MNTHTNNHTEPFNPSILIPDLNKVLPPERLIIHQGFDYYHVCLKCSLPAQERLKQVGIVDNKVIDAFTLGYVDRTLGSSLPDPRSYNGGSQRGLYQRIGLFKCTGHERFRWALVFPLYDIDGNIIGVYGYWVRQRASQNEAKFVLWDFDDVGIFNPSALQNSEKLLLCSTPLQACQLWSRGYRHAMSLMGHDITYEQVQAIFKDKPVSQIELIQPDDLIDRHQFEQLNLYLKSLGKSCTFIKHPYELNG